MAAAGQAEGVWACVRVLPMSSKHWIFLKFYSQCGRCVTPDSFLTCRSQSAVCMRLFFTPSRVKGQIHETDSARSLPVTNFHHSRRQKRKEGRVDERSEAVTLGEMEGRQKKWWKVIWGEGLKVKQSWREDEETLRVRSNLIKKAAWLSDVWLFTTIGRVAIRDPHRMTPIDCGDPLTFSSCASSILTFLGFWIKSLIDW